MSWSFTCPICDGPVDVNLKLHVYPGDGEGRLGTRASCQCGSTSMCSSGPSWVGFPSASSRIPEVGVSYEHSVFEPGSMYLLIRGLGPLEVWRDSVGRFNARVRRVEEAFQVLRVMAVMQS